MVTKAERKAERRLRKIARRRETAAAAENNAAREVSAEPSATETTSGASMRGYPYELISEDEMSTGTDDEGDNTHTDIHDDRVQEMGQVMAASSARINDLASPGDFQFDLPQAFEKLRIAAKQPSDENLEALQSTFGHLGQVTQILLSKNHTAEEVAVLTAAAMRATKRTMHIHMAEHWKGIQDVHMCHSSQIRQIIRRLCAVEGKRQTLPAFADDPEQLFPDTTLLEELEDMLAAFKQIRKSHDSHGAEFSNFVALAVPQLQGQQAKMASQGNQMERMRREMEWMRREMMMKDDRIDELDSKVARITEATDLMAAEMAEIKALLAGRG